MNEPPPAPRRNVRALRAIRPASADVVIENAENARLANLCGPLDEHLRLVERRLGVEIASRGNRFRIIGAEQPVRAAERLIGEMYRLSATEVLDAPRVHLLLQESGIDAALSGAPEAGAEDLIVTRRAHIRPRGPNQQAYLAAIRAHDLTFGVGPAGTGKTYLAVAAAVDALERDEVRRLVLARPAVEAGERLGFLPGDLVQKIDPYLRPLYDALWEMLGFERVARLIERNVIEIAPLAFMRGRTLNEAFVILDEAQNTTVEQMKMFLTRIGFGSRVVVTGDVTQIDLQRGQRSGLRHVVEVLRDVEGIRFVFMNSRDVVRHPLVSRIVSAYEAAEGGAEEGKS